MTDDARDQIARDAAQAALHAIAAHERECAEFRKSISADLARMEKSLHVLYRHMWAAQGSAVSLLIWIAAYLFSRAFPG